MNKERGGVEIRTFILRQIEAVRKEGIFVLVRKTRHWIFMLLALPLVVLVRLLSPFIVIRFGELISRRIGHYAANTENYLCARDADINKRYSFDIFYELKPVSNYQLQKMWKRVLRIWQFAEPVARANRLLPWGKKHIIETRGADSFGYMDSMRPHLSFTPEEERRGREFLANMGIGEKQEFVCLHVRNQDYLNAWLSAWIWEHHNYRDADINSYLKAVEELTDRGYFVFRMGKFIKEPFRTENPRIIDYAVKFQEDFLDIYLSAKCRFFISTGSGLDSIARIFRIPIVYTNFIPLEHIATWTRHDLIILKKMRRRGENSYLTFKEIMNSGYGGFTYSEEYRQHGLEIENNSPEEIRDVVMEMDDRLKGVRRYSDEDEILQKHFGSLFKPNDRNPRGVFLSRVGSDFISNNKHLVHPETEAICS